MPAQVMCSTIDIGSVFRPGFSMARQACCSPGGLSFQSCVVALLFAAAMTEAMKVAARGFYDYDSGVSEHICRRLTALGKPGVVVNNSLLDDPED